MIIVSILFVSVLIALIWAILTGKTNCPFCINKCPICGSETVETGYFDTIYCTECPWSEVGPDFEFAQKYKENLKKQQEKLDKMYEIGKEIKRQRNKK